MTTKDICVGRKYTDKQGQEHTNWNKIGCLFINDDGKMSIKLDLIFGEISAAVFDRKPKEQQQQAPTQNSGVPF